MGAAGFNVPAVPGEAFSRSYAAALGQLQLPIPRARAAPLLNGYSVIEAKPGENAPSASVIVSGEILNVFCDMYMSYTGQVSLVIRLNRDGKELLNRHYAGEGSAGLAVAATSESYSRSLALALQAALQKFISDLNKTLAAEK